MKLKRIHSGLVILLLSLMAPAVWPATITTHLDRNPVNLDGSFRVIFEADGNVDGSPDFSPLEQNFDIINRSQGSSMQIINGQISNKTQWTLTLLAKQAGSFVIPAIRFGRDTSQAVSILVQPARQGQSGDAGEVSLEVTAEPESAYVQSQIIYTVRLLRAVNLVNASLSEPELDGSDAIIEKLGDDREYETWRNGVRYAVIERSYAVFPQQSGKLSIKPVIFEGQIVDRGRSMFDPFAQASRIKRLKSESVELDVKAVPQNVQGIHWLPARELSLAEEWPESAEFKTGEPVTRTITLRAKGLTAAQLPELISEAPDGIKSYPDQPSLNDDKRINEIIGTRQEKTAMIPTQQGAFILPAIEISWWNTLKDRQEVARIPQRTINVVAADPSRTTASTATNALQQADIDARNSNTGREVIPAAAQINPSVSGVWFWVSALLAAGWLSTSIWFFMMHRSARKNVSAKKARTENLSRLKQGLSKACMSGAAADAGVILLNWAKYHWQSDPPQNLGEIAKRCGGYFAEEIDSLNKALYSHNAGQWQGKGLWQAFEQYIASSKPGEIQSSEILAPLYP